MDTLIVVLLVLCLLIGTGNLILFALVARGHLRPRLLRQEFSFKHDFTHRFEGLGGKVEETSPAPSGTEAPDEGEAAGDDADAGPPVVAKLRDMGFAVHWLAPGDGVDAEPHRLGELLIAPSPEDEPPCPNCGEEMHDFLEVIDRGMSADGLKVGWQELGGVCVACGHFRRHDEDDLEPKGVFRHGPADEENLLAFLEEFPAEAMGDLVRNNYRKALVEQERLLMSRVFAVRQQIANADLAAEKKDEEGEENKQ